MTRHSDRLVSIVIDNYNYGRFLGASIESGLEQTWHRTEVIVVDDGSTDESAEVISGYGRSVIPILKSNGGQASAFNEGFMRTRGDPIIFLDADDQLLPTAAQTVAETFADGPISRAYWPMFVIDEGGHRTGAMSNEALPEGDLRSMVLSGGPYMYRWSPTSGNAWSRALLEAILPIPASAFTNYADNFLSALSPIYGIHRSLDPISCWRSHTRNETKQAVSVAPFRERLGIWVARFDECLTATIEHCHRQGLAFDPELWKANSWYHRLERAVSMMDSVVPKNAPIALVDEDAWQTDGHIDERRVFRLMERNGIYWGRPRDEEEIVRELARLRDTGVRFVAIPWSCAWWIEHFKGMADWLRQATDKLHTNADVQIFELN